jgi:hypothetical protein
MSPSHFSFFLIQFNPYVGVRLSGKRNNSHIMISLPLRQHFRSAKNTKWEGEKEKVALPRRNHVGSVMNTELYNKQNVHKNDLKTN